MNPVRHATNQPTSQPAFTPCISSRSIRLPIPTFNRSTDPRPLPSLSRLVHLPLTHHRYPTLLRTHDHPNALVIGRRFTPCSRPPPLNWQRAQDLLIHVLKTTTTSRGLLAFSFGIAFSLKRLDAPPVPPRSTISFWNRLFLRSLPKTVRLPPGRPRLLVDHSSHPKPIITKYLLDLVPGAPLAAWRRARSAVRTARSPTYLEHPANSQAAPGQPATFPLPRSLSLPR